MTKRVELTGAARYNYNGVTFVQGEPVEVEDEVGEYLGNTHMFKVNDVKSQAAKSETSTTQSGGGGNKGGRPPKNSKQSGGKEVDV